MLEEATNNIADIFRGGLLIVLFLFCTNVQGSEFTTPAFRLSQFDVLQVSYGCRASALSLEAKSKYSWSTNRHCVIANLLDISIDDFNEIRQKAGGLVVLLPKAIHLLNAEEKSQLNQLEQAILSQTVAVPVYFVPHNKELEVIISDITKVNGTSTLEKNERKSAISEIFNSISANGYQISVTGASHAPNKNSKIAVIQGELVPNQIIMKQIDNGAELNSNLPIIIVTAHLNTFGLYNDYPLNADVAVLLSIVETFSKLHSIPSATPKFRIIFLVTESGALLNYQGVKKWLDENVSLQNVEFVLCLDTISQGLDYNSDNALFMHVSKPPKEGTSMSAFFKILKSVSTTSIPVESSNVEGVHKKINLAESQLAWEHERFSMKRFAAFTLSSVKNHKHPVRTTIFKDNKERIVKQIQRNANIIAESLARFVFKIEHDEPVFSGALKINENMVKSYLDIKSALHNNDLKDGFEKYLKNVKLVYDKPDIREPDFMLYDNTNAKINIYVVKPALFDLFLTIVICVYLTSVYFAVQYFSHFYELVCKLTKVSIAQSNGNYSERIKSKNN